MCGRYAIDLRGLDECLTVLALWRPNDKRMLTHQSFDDEGNFEFHIMSNIHKQCRSSFEDVSISELGCSKDVFLMLN